MIDFKKKHQQKETNRLLHKDYIQNMYIFKFMSIILYILLYTLFYFFKYMDLIDDYHLQNPNVRKPNKASLGATDEKEREAAQEFCMLELKRNIGDDRQRNKHVHLIH